MATRCSSPRWVAATTTPMPPSPRTLSTRYLPATTVPGHRLETGRGSAGSPAPSRLVARALGEGSSVILVGRAQLREDAEVLERRRVAFASAAGRDVLQEAAA